MDYLLTCLFEDLSTGGPVGPWVWNVLKVLTGLRLYTLVQVVFLRVPQTLLQNVYRSVFSSLILNSWIVGDSFGLG